MPRKPEVISGFIGQLPTSVIAESEPNDRVEQPFPTPEGVKTFSGFGASDADINRGFVDPTISDPPLYEKSNYAERWTDPKVSEDDDAGGMYAKLQEDFDFRTKDRVSRGFLTRPKLPTNR